MNVQVPELTFKRKRGVSGKLQTIQASRDQSEWGGGNFTTHVSNRVILEER